MCCRRLALSAALFAAALLSYGSASRAGSAGDECAAPNSVMALGTPLRHTGERLLHGLPVKIVAIGSSSTVGVGASDAAHTYPSQLAAALAHRFPAAAVSVVNKGVNGEETPEMLARFQRDVFDEHPDLVIWQTGSNEILRHSDPDAFRAQVIDGLNRLHEAGVETILMDAQYAPRILDNPAYASFNEKLRKLALRAKLAFLDRFEAMRYWLTKDAKAGGSFVSKDQVHMTDAGYHCVGQLLASLITAELPALAAR
jgi:acyl-CoA thioesterase I